MDQVNSKKPLHSFIGEAMVAEGILTPDQLTRALRIQEKLEQPRQLGEVLVDLGYVSKQTITEVVRKRGRGVRLGDILVEQGIISAETLASALDAQRETGAKLGETLISMGAINERTLLQNLASQCNVAYIEPSMGLVESGLLERISPEFLERYCFVPFSRNEDGNIVVVVPRLDDEDCLQALNQKYAGGYTMALGPQEAIKQTIDELRQFRMSLLAKGGVRSQSEQDSVVMLVNHILRRAVEERASDIHIEPMSNKVRLRYRIDGVLVFKTDLPLDMLPKIVSRIKVLAECNITEHQRHQGGRILYELDGRSYDLRLSIYVTVHGECVVIRVLNKEMGLISLEELGMAPSMLERYRTDVLDLPTGVVLITGPTGSGKTSTLYSSLAYCNNINTKIITAEDPVEYLIDGIIQCSIFDKVGRTFDASLREIVRQDPDIIVLGEIRDRVSAETAIQAALTGHKVYSTFHTEDTIGGLLRLIDMDIETFLISSTVISVVAQRLLRRICSHCAVPYTPSIRDIITLGLDLKEISGYEFKKGQGCKACAYTGYYGRIAVYELLVLNEAVKEAILQKRPAHVIRNVSVETTGLVSMCEDAIGKVLRGITTFEEVLKHTPRTMVVRPVRQIMTLTQ